MICVSEVELLERKSTVKSSWGQAWLCHSSWVAGLRHLKLLQAGKNAPAPHAAGLMSQQNCLRFHTRQCTGKSRGAVSEVLAQAVAVPLISSFIYPIFINSTKRAVFLGDVKYHC